MIYQPFSSVQRHRLQNGSPPTTLSVALVGHPPQNFRCSPLLRTSPTPSSFAPYDPAVLKNIAALLVDFSTNRNVFEMTENHHLRFIDEPCTDNLKLETLVEAHRNAPQLETQKAL